MYEELYVIDGGRKMKVDLSSPSGITLNFKSNIFGDLSKITCSHSYTFKLPKTTNNRRLFDNADDVRTSSNMVRRRLKVEYLQNGFSLFKNPTLYIDSTETCFNAVMTWGVIEGLQKIKDNDISLRELPSDGIEVPIGPYKLNGKGISSITDSIVADDGSTIYAFDNLADVIGPEYNCGVPYRVFSKNVYDNGSGRPNVSWNTKYNTPPLPTVPVNKIISKISDKYGVTFNLGKHITSANVNDVDSKTELIELGVIPLVSTNLTKAQLQKKRCEFGGQPTFSYINKTLEEIGVDGNKTTAYFADIIRFGAIAIWDKNYFESGQFNFKNSNEFGDNVGLVGVVPRLSNLSVEIDGHLTTTFTEYYQGASNTDEPTLVVWQRQLIGSSGGFVNTPRRQIYEWKELASLSGEQVGKDGNYYIYDFDFSAENFSDPLEFENVSHSDSSPILFSFNKRLRSISQEGVITVNLVNSDENIHNMDVFSNLPDISCFTFMKSLFYMIGACPSVNSDGEIVPLFYSDIRRNLFSGNVYDWSGKVLSIASAIPEKVAYALTEYAQKNMFLTKSDEESQNKEEDSIDVYENGAGVLVTFNEILEKEKTIIQIPFNAPYGYDKKYKDVDMGHTFKCWAFEKEKGKKIVKWVEPKPCMGLIKDRSLFRSTNEGPLNEVGSVMSMAVWNGFAEIESNESFSYLQRIIKNPIVITEKLRLNELDLLNLDSSVPVYLDKYNAYFAIVSITRDSKGVCKCELIKLPEEE